MEKNESSIQPGLAQYEIAIDIEANTQELWYALTEQIGTWWLPSFHMLGESSDIKLELRAGGRLAEIAEGSELLWYTVIAFDVGKSIDLVGYCTAKYGGPVTTMLSIEVVRLSEQTSRLRVTDALFGRVTDGFVRSVERGWKELFGDGLKRFVERDK